MNVIRFQIAFLCFVITASRISSSNPRRATILVVGATGSTGLRAIQGLLDVGYKPRQVRLLTRNAKSPKCKALKMAGFGIVEADLEDLKSLQSKGATRGCTECYIHSTSSDTAVLDTGEVTRAENLARVILSEKNRIRHIVYNSAAAQGNHGVGRIQQKHDVEKVFERAVQERNDDMHDRKGSATIPLSFTALRANIFMEELWKSYTRPQILNGTYPLPVPSSRKLYLVSVRDLGRFAGTIMKDIGHDNLPNVQTINVAGDYLSATDIADAFANAQNSPCTHYNPRSMVWKAWWYFPELYEQIRFLQTFTETTDIDQLREDFPAILTSFPAFLQDTDTHWSDKERVFEDLASVASLHR